MSTESIVLTEGLRPVGPSPVVRIVMGPMTGSLNPLILKLAGKKHFPFSGQVRHVGRRSGKLYATPVSARKVGQDIVIALTFGNRSDWSRNVVAAGRCSIRLNGVTYEAFGPELLNRKDNPPLVRAAFSLVQRLAFVLLGIRQFMYLRVEGPAL